MRVFSQLDTNISIHALREESDVTCVPTFSDLGISIHALREESDLDVQQHIVICPISIHALREESDWARSYVWLACDHISIHALREESDKVICTGSMRWKNFYPRSP